MVLTIIILSLVLGMVAILAVEGMRLSRKLDKQLDLFNASNAYDRHYDKNWQKQTIGKYVYALREKVQLCEKDLTRLTDEIRYTKARIKDSAEQIKTSEEQTLVNAARDARILIVSHLDAAFPGWRDDAFSRQISAICNKEITLEMAVRNLSILNITEKQIVQEVVKRTCEQMEAKEAIADLRAE